MSLLLPIIAVKPLSPQLDQEFRNLHNALLGHGQMNFPAFETAALQYFDTCPKSGSDQEAYFNNFIDVWRIFIGAGNYKKAEDVWIKALAPALKWEKARPRRHIHKGAPFLFWGGTELLKGNIDKGFILIHRAVEEDKINNPTGYMGSPAYAPVVMNSQKLDQAFLPWVKLNSDFVDTFIGVYRRTYKRKLRIQAFQRRFLLKFQNEEVAFVFAHTVARLREIDVIPVYARKSAFISQVYLSLLFDIALVIEAAIKQHNSKGHQFSDHAHCLSVRSGLGLGNRQITNLGKAYRNNFETTFQSVINNTYIKAGGGKLGGLARDVAIAYGIRNLAAHNIGSSAFVDQKFKEIRQSIFNALFLTVETFYK